MRRAPPGDQVGAGRIRVDAAKALAKLRSYRLADPTAWILEAVRAAIGAGASAITLDGDADEVWLRWHGPPWPAAELPRLFDELVSPELGSGGYHRRLLATAINSALGLGPAWIDVIAIDGPAATRVRFTPAAVAVADGEDAPRHALAAESIAPPAPIARGMVVHLRRPASLDVLARFLRGAEPPELTLARRACADVVVPLAIAGAPVGRAIAGGDLLRAPLGPGLDGFVAIVDPTTAPVEGDGGALDVAELGVRLTRASWLPAALARLGTTRPRPLRLLVDGPRMPSNASRSQVRRDVHPIEPALRDAEAITATLIARLAEAGQADPSPGLRAAALALLAPADPALGWPALIDATPRALAALAALPLLRSAVGTWRRFDASWRPEIYRGERALPAELAPWLDDVLWLPPGDPAAVLASAPADEAATRAVIRAARTQRRRRARFLARPTQPARVELRAESRVRAALGAGPPSCVPDGVLDGLRGEVCVAAGTGAGRVTLLLDGRVLDRAPLDGPLAVEAVIDGAPLTADAHYRAARRDAGWERAVAAAVAGAIRAVEALADDEAHAGVTIAAPRRDPDDVALFRGALAFAYRCGYAVPDDTPLATAAIWPLAGGGRASLAALRRTRAIGAIVPGAHAVAPAERPLVAVAPEDRPLLAGLLAPTALVPYDGHRGLPPIDPAAVMAGRVADRTGAATLVVRGDRVNGAIAYGDDSRLLFAHRGAVLVEVARSPARADCVAAIDSDALVPTADWSALRDDAGLATIDLTSWEDALLVACARALLGDPTPDLALRQRPIRLDDATGRGLARAIAAGGLAALPAGLPARLRAHPMFTVRGQAAPISADAILAAAPAGPIPALPASALIGCELGDDPWAPLIGDDDVAALFRALSGRATFPGAAELSRRSAAAAHARRVAAHRARPTAPVALSSAHRPRPIGGGLRGVIGCAVPAEPQLVVLVSCEARPCARIVSSPDLPALAAIDVDLADLDDALANLRPAAWDRILPRVRAAIGDWLAATADDDPTELADHAPTRTLLAAWLASAADDDPRRAAIRAAAAWPTVQGARCTIDAATVGPTVKVATWLDLWTPGPPAHALDAPVIAVPADPEAPLRAVLDRLGPWFTDDVTAEVRRLQTSRRIARGVVAAPTIPNSDPALTRRLDQLGLAHDLGPGAIALVEVPGSALLVHDDGALAAWLPIDAQPPVQLAIEDPDLRAQGKAGPRFAAIAAALPALVGALLRAVTDALGVDLPPWLRRHLRHALLADAIDPAPIERAPIFDTTAGRLVSWSEVLEQQARFRDVWAVRSPPVGPPLDPLRLVLYLDEREVELAGKQPAITLVGASRLLAQDAIAIANRARAPVTELAVPAAARAGALAIAELPGGGFVVPLHPQHAGERGVLAHHRRVPFDRMPDACTWPTLAVVEEAALVPDRSYATPIADATWHALLARVEEASRAALRTVVTAPPDAMARVTIDAWTDPTERARAVTGALWLTFEDEAGTITVATQYGYVEIDAPDRLPIGGHLFAFPHPPALDRAVHALARVWYPRLRRQAGLDDPAAALAALPGIPPPPRRAPTADPPTAAPPVPPAPAPPPIAAHPLQPLAAALRTRLHQLGPPGAAVTRMMIASDDAQPILAFDRGALILAGAAPLLGLLATAADREAALDALAAHALAVLTAAGVLAATAERDALRALLAPG